MPEWMCGVQSSWVLVLGMTGAVALVLVATARARMTNSLEMEMDRGILDTADHSCQVGHGAVDGSDVCAATRLSAPQIAAYAVKTACDAVHSAVQRCASSTTMSKYNMHSWIALLSGGKCMSCLLGVSHTGIT